jgi:hypothetical protein
MSAGAGVVGLLELLLGHRVSFGPGLRLEDLAIRALKRTDLYARSRKGMRRINVVCATPIAASALSCRTAAASPGTEDNLNGVRVLTIDGGLDCLAVVL